MRNMFGCNNPNWKGGVHCIDCGKPIWYTAKRCRKCYIKFNVGKNHSNHGVSNKGKKNPNWRGGNKKCDVCGELFTHNNKKTKICRFCYKGKRNHAWKGGIGKEPYPYGWTEALKESIRQRDKHKCQLCGVSQIECVKKLAVHHIDYNKNNLDPKNLTTLCIGCNTKVNSNRKYWVNYFIA